MKTYAYTITYDTGRTLKTQCSYGAAEKRLIKTLTRMKKEGRVMSWMKADSTFKPIGEIVQDLIDRQKILKGKK